jgi:hypothetical protein
MYSSHGPCSFISVLNPNQKFQVTLTGASSTNFVHTGHKKFNVMQTVNIRETRRSGFRIFVIIYFKTIVSIFRG